MRVFLGLMLLVGVLDTFYALSLFGGGPMGIMAGSAVLGSGLFIITLAGGLGSLIHRQEQTRDEIVAIRKAIERLIDRMPLESSGTVSGQSSLSELHAEVRSSAEVTPIEQHTLKSGYRLRIVYEGEDGNVADWMVHPAAVEVVATGDGAGAEKRLLAWSESDRAERRFFLARVRVAFDARSGATIDDLWEWLRSRERAV